MAAEGENGGYAEHYSELLPHVRRTLEVLFACDAEESIVTVTSYVLAFRFHDSTDITSWMPPLQPQIVTRGRIMEAVCSWVGEKLRALDSLIPLVAQAPQLLAVGAKRLREQLAQAAYRGTEGEAVAEFINMVVVELLGREAAVLGSALAGTLVSQEGLESICEMVEYPTLLLSWLVRGLAEIESKVAKVILEVYADLMTRDEARKQLSQFFQHFTVQTATGSLEVHDSYMDQTFCDSPFSVKLIHSYGDLMKLLLHLENTVALGRVSVAVDFEGVKLCRHGVLCLVQMTISDNPRLVYVLDVHVLGRGAFTLLSPRGMSVKAVLENESITKVWFDPRNDVDALYHQFGIQPRGIFDLQLAEIATRRHRGFHVSYLRGLHKCLSECPQLKEEQKSFASQINEMGKELFEPQNGGSYEIFEQRPLNPIILVYAAHDSRYMLVLYEQYMSAIGAIGEDWVARVIHKGNERGLWYLSREYTLPSSDAPDF